MDDTTLETLEYPAVLKELSGFTVTAPGREKIERLKPSPEIGFIRRVFEVYSEAAEVIGMSGRFPLGGVADIRDALARSGLAGSYLLPEELLQVKGNLQSAAYLKRYLSEISFRLKYPKVSSMIEGVSEEKALLSELDRVLDEKGQIKDSASQELFRIRKELRSGRERARGVLEGFCGDKKFKEFLQEDFITIRDDRYVVSIKAGMHAGFDGVIHGRSNSGATYFIEPLKLVELNNRIAILKKEEKAEEIEILKASTVSVFAAREPLLHDLEVFGELDSLQARALFSKEIKAIVPLIRERGGVEFRSARHPLLIIKETMGMGRTVPVDLRIPGGKSALVISGANTGGKTVALKTLGLLTLMVLSGIPVPVAEGSEAVVFDSIFSDIGDRQDIIANLSTFSAHVKRIGSFLDQAGPGSLVMIDEIGAGTDPSEGGAFALAALEAFREKGAITVITTHLNLLKAHAKIDPKYLNASVEFDENTLHPLYRLHYGIPGPSLGLSIARGLGISEGLIERARSYLSEKEGAFIESVKKIEEEKEELEAARKRLSDLEAQRAHAVERLRAERRVILDKARAKIDDIVLKAREDIRKAVEKMKEEGVLGKRPARAVSGVEEAAARAMSRLSLKPAERYRPEPGDKVVILGSNNKGVVLAVDEDAEKAELRVGNLKVWVAWERLNKRGGKEKAGQYSRASAGTELETAATINIIGLRVGEALALVTKFIDNAHAGGLASVEIIHGIGTGRLSKAVEEYLAKNTIVKRFYHSDRRGGAGVTIAELT